jgi:hypothetical protein
MLVYNLLSILLLSFSKIYNSIDVCGKTDAALCGRLNVWSVYVISFFIIENCIAVIFLRLVHFIVVTNQRLMFAYII